MTSDSPIVNTFFLDNLFASNFKHKGQTYKVDMSSMRGYSNDTNVNNGNKITLKANDYFIKGHTINMNDVDYEIK